jgi:hypothetical protein
MVGNTRFTNKKFRELCKCFNRESFKITVYVVVAKNYRKGVNLIGRKFSAGKFIYESKLLA